MVNAAQQLRGALGTALLNPIFASVALEIGGHAAAGAPIGAGGGYRVVLLVAAGLFALAALIAGALMRGRPTVV